MIGIRYEERGNDCAGGLTLWDRPDMPLLEMVEALAEGDDVPALQRRMFVGRRPDGGVTVNLSGSQGRERIRMGIDAADVPSLEILDGQGAVAFRAPPAD